LQPRFSAENCLQDFAVDIDEEFMDISMASEDLMFLATTAALQGGFIGGPGIESNGCS